MKYTIRKSVVEVIGTIWMPSTTAARQFELSDYDVNNARDDEGKVTRDSVQRWLDTHAGDFAGITDFWASIEDGENTVDIPWASEDSELTYNDCMYGDEDEDDEPEEDATEPGEDDGMVSLDRGAYYVSLGDVGPADQPRDGYPTRAIAVYELARLAASAGEFPPAWVTGEHGPAYADISAEVYAHLDDDDQVKPLPGVKYKRGDIVSVTGDDWPTWVVDGDYGDLGVMVYTRGDPTITALVKHDQLSPYVDDDAN